MKVLGWVGSVGLSILLFCAAPAWAAQVHSAVITAASGRIQGTTLDGVTSFKGIPFAAPPVGPLRWRPPQPVAPWQGVRQAVNFGSPCMQSPSPHRLGPWTTAFLSKLPSSEDCLYLNLWTAAARSSSLRPVMVWIYGGGFTSGAGSVAIYDGAALAREGVVVVNCNYRVGAFGFLAYPGLTDQSPHHSSGNYALLDQIAALKWVKENIAAFGGDPHQVTIFGQSAGAASVWLLMQSPLARGLFERAIVMSGPAVIPARAITGRGSLASAEREGRQFAATLGAHSAAELRAVPAEKILKASSHMRWAPIQDGWVISAGHPRREVPVICGMVADDIGIGYYGTGPAPPVTLNDYQRTMRQICGTEAQTCANLYPAASDEQAANAIRNALQDRARVSLYEWAARQTQRSPKVYIYYFNQEIPWPQHPEYRVFHSSELPYVFDNLPLLHRPWQPVDRRVAQDVSTYWTNFAKTGSPDSEAVPAWPAFRPGGKTIMELGARMGPRPLASSARLQFWTKRLATPLGF